MVLVPQRFRHLGGSGLWLDAGSQRCSVTGSHFTDLSGAGVMVGGIGDPAQDNAALFTAANTVSGNTIVNVSQEYHGGTTPLSPLFLGRFAPVFRRFSAVILCCPASWRQDGENGRKMAKNGRNLGEKRARNSGG